MKYDEQKIAAIAEVFLSAQKKLNITEEELASCLPRNSAIRHWVTKQMRKLAEENQAKG